MIGVGLYFMQERVSEKEICRTSIPFGIHPFQEYTLLGVLYLIPYTYAGQTLSCPHKITIDYNKLRCMVYLK